jgi:hypothetical protein
VRAAHVGLAAAILQPPSWHSAIIGYCLHEQVVHDLAFFGSCIITLLGDINLYVVHVSAGCQQQQHQQ